ncbi:hypothetical protein ABTZ93_41970, partial [Streptomyces sp. NPDC097941]|uniref:hypothetical protein n=1 Tax=Streptomyces sp. NPDC097941 TaxID=3155685 RepID=UPI0033310626
TAEYSRHHERPNHLTGHARPGHINKIVLRALRSNAVEFLDSVEQHDVNAQWPRPSRHGSRRLGA